MASLIAMLSVSVTAQRVSPFMGQDDLAKFKTLGTVERRAYIHQLEQLARGHEVAPKGHVSRQAPRRAESGSTVLIEEDFSLMATGTEDAPDFETVCWDEDENILPAFTHQPGWWGEGVYPAGGTCALAYPEYGGLLTTPLGCFKGKVKISFRVKSFDEYRHYFFVSVLRGGVEDVRQAGEEYWAGYVYGEDGWQDFEFETIVPYDSDDQSVQINAISYDNGIIVDDFRVTVDDNYVLTPSNLSTAHYGHDGFTVAWDAVDGVQDYLVNLYQLKPQGEGSVTVTEDFEQLTADADGHIDAGSVPEGWTFELNDPQIGEGRDGSKGVAFIGSATTYQAGSVFYEGNGGRIENIVFWIKKTQANSDMLEEWGYVPYITLYGWDGADWKSITDIDLDGEVGESMQVDVADIMNNKGKDFVGLYTKIEFNGGLMDYGAFVLDDVSISTESPTDTLTVYKDVVTETNHLAFADIDTDYEYLFTVQARRDADHLSEVSMPTHVFGVAAPVALPATDIDERGEFTANWEAEPKANLGYIVRVNKVFTAPLEMADYEILSEDFSLVDTDATVDDWESYGNKSGLTTLDDATHLPGWLGRGNIMAYGMLGCREDADQEGIYEIITPPLKLSNGDKTYKVTVTAYFYDDDALVVQGAHRASFEGKAGQTVTATVEMTDGDDATRVWFYTQNYGAFMLDDVKITQTLAQGDQVVTTCDEAYTDETSYTFSGLDADDGTSYSYVVYAGRELWGEQAVSEPSNEILVNLKSNPVGIKSVGQSDNSQLSNSIYDLSGLHVAKMKKPGVYLVKSNGLTVKRVVR